MSNMITFSHEITGCVTELPEVLTVHSKRHIEFNLYESDVAGCHVTTERDHSTLGPVRFTFYADGSEQIEFILAGFRKCGSYQGDIRDVDEQGTIVSYHDFLLARKENCIPAAIIGGDPWQQTGSITLPTTSEKTGSTSPTPTSHSSTPVPEPSTALMVLPILLGYALWKFLR